MNHKHHHVFLEPTLSPPERRRLPPHLLPTSTPTLTLMVVRGDLAKAEEYCGRAILANPSDANTLSMYADIIWEYRRDGELAESYFDQAIKAAPEN
uniref:Tetratricopeptide repeat protein n=1 Tax=Chenopodium quinoa TaxID=63459 RepID=A0A803LN15_CHEQI